MYVNPHSDFLTTGAKKKQVSGSGVPSVDQWLTVFELYLPEKLVHNLRVEAIRQF